MLADDIRCLFVLVDITSILSMGHEAARRERRWRRAVDCTVLQCTARRHRLIQGTVVKVDDSVERILKQKDSQVNSEALSSCKGPF